MTERISRAETLEIVRTVHAADCACAETTFLEDGLLVTPAEERPGQRRFPRPVKPLLVVTMGRGVVVSCHPERVAWLHNTLAPRERDEIFWAPTIAQVAGYVARDGQDLHGPAMKYVCTPQCFRPAPVPSEIAISVLAGAEVSGLYQYAGFGHALSYRPDHPRPDVVAAVARHAGMVVGIAAASADCETLWQVGDLPLPRVVKRHVRTLLSYRSSVDHRSSH